MREQIRIWTENVETFVLEVITEQRRDKKAAVVRFCLFLLSKVFAVLVKIRRFLYNVRILRDSTLGVQVIAVGNLTVGGTGKTPVVEKFARELQDQGRTVAILSRGTAPNLRRSPNVSSINCSFATIRLRRVSSPMANRSSSIPKRPATSPTCWLPISKT